MHVIIGFLYDILWKIHTSLDLLMSVGKRKLIAAVYNKMKERAANQLMQVRTGGSFFKIIENLKPEFAMV